MTKQPSPKLPNAPLQEVVFEVNWELDIDPTTNQQTDSKFDLAQGVFANTVMKAGFPIWRRMPNASLGGIIASINNYQPLHQFWAGQNQWPVLQIGPGIMTVNDTERNYSFEGSFYSLIGSSLDILHDSYQREMKFSRVSLRYINSVELNGEQIIDLTGFLGSNLLIDIKKGFEIPGRLSNISLHEVYLLDDGSELNIAVGSGNRFDTNKPAILWQNALTKNGSFDLGHIKEWLSQAHEVTSQLFKQMASKEFYESFK